MHGEGTPPAGGHGQDGYAERAETYLRLLAEAALRPAADGDTSRVRRAADVLVDAGVLADLQLALRVRGRREVSAPGTRMRRLAGFRPRQAPGLPGTQPKPWRVLSAGQPAPPSRPLAVLGGTDDLGNHYRIGFDGTWPGSTWTGAIILHPAPPGGCARRCRSAGWPACGPAASPW